MNRDTVTKAFDSVIVVNEIVMMKLYHCRSTNNILDTIMILS